MRLIPVQPNDSFQNFSLSHEPPCVIHGSDAMKNTFDARQERPLTCNSFLWYQRFEPYLMIMTKNFKVSAVLSVVSPTPSAPSGASSMERSRRACVYVVPKLHIPLPSPSNYNWKALQSSRWLDAQPERSWCVSQSSHGCKKFLLQEKGNNMLKNIIISSSSSILLLHFFGQLWGHREIKVSYDLIK